MSELPSRVASLVKKAGKKPLKFMLFRLPKDMTAKDLHGVQIDLTDLKVTSVDGNISAIPDMLMDSERASACPLVPDEAGSDLKCGDVFAASIQIIKQAKSKSSESKTKQVSVEQPAVQSAIKKERKLKKVKSEA